MSSLLFGICPCAVRYGYLIGKFVSIILISRLPGFWNRLTQEETFLLGFRGRWWASRAPVVVVSIKTTELFCSLVLQAVIRVRMGVGVLNILRCRYRTTLEIVLSVAHTRLLFGYYVQCIVRPRLPAPSPAVTVMPAVSLVLFFEMVHPSPSAFAHRRLSYLYVFVVSVVHNVIRELDLVRPCLRSGPPQNWSNGSFLWKGDHLFWFFLYYFYVLQLRRKAFEGVGAPVQHWRVESSHVACFFTILFLQICEVL